MWLISQKLKYYVGHFGLVDTCWYALSRMLVRSPLRLTKHYVVAQRVGLETLLPPSRGRKIGVRGIRKADYPAGEHPCPRPPRVITERYQQNAFCLGAFKEEYFSGCLWYVKEQYQEDVVNCTYQLAKRDCVWDFDVFVVPEYRLTPVFLKLWDTYFECLRRDGVQWSMSRIDAFNPESRNAHKRMGAAVLGSVLFFGIGSWQLTLSNLRPHIHIATRRERAPVYILEAPL